MRFNRFTLTLIALFIACSSFSQDTQPKNKKISYRNHMKLRAEEQITELKKGALLVELKTKALTINALRQKGKSAQADEIERNQQEFNRTIISAFKANYTFSPVYFFYSTYANDVKAKQFQKVVFLNDRLEPDTTVKVIGSTFLIAEFGTVQQDTAKYLSRESFEPSENFSLKKTEQYHGGPYFGYEALIIRNDQFVQLRDPFPYFVRTRDTYPKRKKVYKVVKVMNRKLDRFYTSLNKSS